MTAAGKGFHCWHLWQRAFYQQEKNDVDGLRLSSVLIMSQKKINITCILLVKAVSGDYGLIYLIL